MLGASVAQISIHAPHTRGDPCPPPLPPAPMHFNPRPSYEGRQGFSPQDRGQRFDFNPRPSYEGRPDAIRAVGEGLKFQSTPLIRGATVRPGDAHDHHHISIHAPHTRGDGKYAEIEFGNFQFQSTPLIRGATDTLTLKGVEIKFQSTPLIRGATPAKARRTSPCSNFNPRP